VNEIFAAYLVGNQLKMQLMFHAYNLQWMPTLICVVI
jgi:hypothetical protein